MGRIKRKGFDSDFLGADFGIALPQAGEALAADVLTKSRFADGVIDYVHYSVMMSKINKQALFSAANVDFSKYEALPVGEGRDWFRDKRIGYKNQLPNYSYQFSRWDRGHLTRRAAVAWGKSYAERLKASNDSCSYANAVMQHEFFNEDEWRAVEELVKEGGLAKKLNVITGPIFTRADRYYTREMGDFPVRIPAGLWKIICYVDKRNQLQTQAYVFMQDEDIINSRGGRDGLKLKNYQVTTREITCWSGLNFDAKLYESNPLKFYGGPERISVANHKKLLNSEAFADLEVSITDNESISDAREQFPLDEFYELIKKVSWV